MNAMEEEKVKEGIRDFYDSIADDGDEEVWRDEEPLSETEDAIAKILEPLGARSRAEAVMNVMSHDDELFAIVIARITWELRNHYEFTCIKDKGRLPPKNDIDRAMGAQFDRISAKVVKENFPDEYKRREMQKLQYELKTVKKGREE